MQGVSLKKLRDKKIFLSESIDMEKKYKKILLTIIEKYVPGCKVYLFGSRARRTHQSGADIDLAIDTGKTVDYEVIFKILGDIEETTIPLFVDVVDLYSASDELKSEVEKDGILWTR